MRLFTRQARAKHAFWNARVARRRRRRRCADRGARARTSGAPRAQHLNFRTRGNHQKAGRVGARHPTPAAYHANTQAIRASRIQQGSPRAGTRARGERVAWLAHSFENITARNRAGERARGRAHHAPRSIPTRRQKPTCTTTTHYYRRRAPSNRPASIDHHFKSVTCAALIQPDRLGVSDCPGDTVCLCVFMFTCCVCVGGWGAFVYCSIHSTGAHICWAWRAPLLDSVAS